MPPETFENALKALQQRKPFRPFTVEPVSGDRFEVDFPNALGDPRRRRRLHRPRRRAGPLRPRGREPVDRRAADRQHAEPAGALGRKGSRALAAIPLRSFSPYGETAEHATVVLARDRGDGWDSCRVRVDQRQGGNVWSFPAPILADYIYISGGAIAAILLILLVVWLIRRT